MKFLALTALSEFWDKGKKIVFLGEWCKLYSKKNEWSSLDFEDAPFCWNNTEKITEGIHLCDQIYEKVLRELTCLLNVYHKTEKDTQYYRIILGNWCYHFLYQLCDKYLTLRTVFEKYPDINTWRLDDSQFYVPLEYNDYIIEIQEDAYSLQLYSQVLTAMGHCFETKKLSHPLRQKYRYFLPVSMRDRLVTAFTGAVSFVVSLPYKKSVTIVAPCLSGRGLLKFILGIKKAIYDPIKYPVDVSFRIDKGFRRKVLSLNGHEFESIVSSVILSNVPVLFLEGFKAFRKTVLDSSIKGTPVFFTANALHSNNVFKFFIAENRRKMKVLAMQHGGGYGLEYINTSEKYERSVADIFYTFGWEDGVDTRYLPHPMLEKKDLKNKTAKNVLLAMTSSSRYLYRFHYQPISSGVLTEYFYNTLNFIRSVHTNVPLIIRTDPAGYFNFNDRLFESFEKEKIPFRIGGEASFDREINQASILMVDHVSTTPFLEFMALNKPTIAFCDKKTFKPRKAAEPFLDQLEKAKILHYSPQQAADHLNSVYEDVDAWWQRQDVQKARREFADRYARTSKAWVREWKDEFDRILSLDRES